jgi:hypothetical protein
MFRLFAIALVVAAFGATLYYSGDTLEAWESPQPAVKAAPQSPKKKAKRRHREAKKVAPSVPRWILRLERLCRRGQAQSDSVRPPSGPKDTLRYLDDVARMNERWNRKAVVLLHNSRGRSNPKVKELYRLFTREDALVKNMLTAARNGQVKRLGEISQALLAVAKSENKVLIKMDAVACTVSPDVFRL